MRDRVVSDVAQKCIWNETTPISMLLGLCTMLYDLRSGACLLAKEAYADVCVAICLHCHASPYT